MKTFIKLFILFAMSFSLVTLNAQDQSTKQPLRLIVPQVYNTDPTPPILDVVISIGPFDNYRISNTNGFMETDIAGNPANPLNFTASDNRVTGFVGTPLIFYTTDGGVNWLSSSIGSNQGDPAFTMDSSGNSYVAVLSSGVRVYKSVNGGVSWTNLGNAFNNSQADKEWIAADPTNSPYKNNLYIVYVNFAAGANVDLWRSTNNGSSWLGPQTIGTSSTNAGPEVCVGPDGRVYAIWESGTGAALRISTDGGASFGTTYVAASYSEPGVYHAPSGRRVLKGDVRVNGHPKAAVDMSSGSRRGNLYITYASNPPGPDNADVFCTTSTDGGVTWNQPVLVNNDGIITDNWIPDVSVDRQGRVWIMFWDSRDDASNNLTHTYAAWSTDGGNTFSNVRVSSQNFNPASIKENQGNHYYMGDYMGIASTNNITFPCYTGQGNTRQDFVAYLPDYGMSFARPVDSINPGTNRSNIVQIPMMGNYSGTVTYSAALVTPPGTGTLTFGFTPSNVKTLTGIPDSLTITATTSSNCSLGLYTCNVTGVENGGVRTHVRSFTIEVTTVPLAVHNQQNQIPDQFTLYQNYPNPFNPATMIDFNLPKQSVVTLKIFDILGREVATLLNGSIQSEGFHTETFNAANLPSGIYYYRLSARQVGSQTGDFVDVKKMVLIK